MTKAIAFSLIGKLLGAIIAIPKIGDIVSFLVQAAVHYYVTNMNTATAAAFFDAAALAQNAKTDEERFKASETWITALSRPRYSK